MVGYLHSVDNDDNLTEYCEHYQNRKDGKERAGNKIERHAQLKVYHVNAMFPHIFDFVTFQIQSIMGGMMRSSMPLRCNSGSHLLVSFSLDAAKSVSALTKTS